MNLLNLFKSKKPVPIGLYEGLYECKPMSNPTELELELVHALVGMACQYLTNGDDIVQCDYVSAIEHCIDVLKKLDLFKPSENGKLFLRDEAFASDWLENHLRGDIRKSN